MVLLLVLHLEVMDLQVARHLPGVQEMVFRLTMECEDVHPYRLNHSTLLCLRTRIGHLHSTRKLLKIGTAEDCSLKQSAVQQA